MMISKGMIPKKIINSLWQRWPDSELLESYYVLLGILKKSSRRLAKKFDDLDCISLEAFKEVCQFVIEMQSEVPFYNSKSSSGKVNYDSLKCLILNKNKWTNLSRLQSIASVLGMLMHFSSNVDSPGLLVNRRRPQKKITTYPTSPSVTRLIADYALKKLLISPIPSCCKSLAYAENYAKHSLNFRILDPSMESGQFLLEVAISLVRLVYKQHSPNSKEVSYLNQALLEYLCGNCLWGIDRNPRAVIAIQTVFIILSSIIGVSNISLANLFEANSLECLNGGHLSGFNCILNNPPWGKLLGSNDRNQIQEFETTKYQKDTYIAFSELAIRCLQPDGIYALVLPSQSIATCNSSRLRALMTNKSHIEHIVLLPRSAFVEATVRGLVILGRIKSNSQKPRYVNVIKYPIEKAISSKGDVVLLKIPQRDFERLGGTTWIEVLSEVKVDFSNVLNVKLGQVAEVYSGVKLYCKGRGSPPQTNEIVKNRPFSSSPWFPDAVPAIRGRNVLDFQLENANEFVKFGPWLAQIGKHETLINLDRIFVRELTRRDGKLNAAFGKGGIIPLHGVITVVPKMINIYILVAILNSHVVAEYVKKQSASFTKVDFQKITIGELRRIPIPANLIAREYRKELKLESISNDEVVIQKNIIKLVKDFAMLLEQNPSYSNKDRKYIETIIAKLYGKRKEC